MMIRRTTKHYKNNSLFSSTFLLGLAAVCCGPTSALVPTLGRTILHRAFLSFQPTSLSYQPYYLSQTCSSSPLLQQRTQQQRQQQRRRSSTERTVLYATSSFGKTVVLSTIALALSSAIKIIPQGDVAIVERLGKFQTQLGPGLHLLIPIVDRIRQRVTCREQVFDIPPQGCITSDNAPLSADAVVYWRVVDAKRAIYEVVDLELAIQNLVLTSLRAEIGKLTLDMTFSARQQINTVILEDLEKTTEPWGVTITRVEVRDIIPNREILKAMELQMAAERTKRAAIIQSEGERDRAVNEAEGEARSQLIEANATATSVVLLAQAEATKLEMEAVGVAQALNTIASTVGGMKEATRFQLMRDYVSSQRDLATSSNAKVIVTSGSADDVFAKAVAFYDTTTTTSSSKNNKNSKNVASSSSLFSGRRQDQQQQQQQRGERKRKTQKGEKINNTKNNKKGNKGTE